jgi:DNA polymerase III subunit beta
MEVSIKREELLQGLYLVQGVVERRSPQPILAHVLIEPVEGGVALTATDMEVGIRAQVCAQIKKKAAATVSARKLYEIVREITADEVTLKSVSAGWVEVLAGRSRFRVVGLDPKDFPELPFSSGGKDVVPIKIAAGTLREMIDKTLFAVSTDETRFNLSGVYVHSADKGVLRMTATDGHRLALIDRAIGGPELPRGVIMPRKGLVEVRKLLEEGEESELTLVVGSQYVRVQTPAVSFFMRLVEGEFPDYKQVIPGASKVKARANRDDLLGALRRISLLASDRSHGVKLNLKKGSLELSASNPDMGEASEDIEVSYSGEPLAIGFNVRYLIELLSVHAPGDTIDLALTDEVGPGVLQGSQDPSFTYVLMPMRL